jgi:hypothetical protein
VDDDACERSLSFSCVLCDQRAPSRNSSSAAASLLPTKFSSSVAIWWVPLPHAVITYSLQNGPDAIPLVNAEGRWARALLTILLSWRRWKVPAESQPNGFRKCAGTI